MDQQTNWMIGKEKPYTVVAKDDDGYFGIEYVNHPTPSGSERHLPTYSDKRRWPDAETAKKEFQDMLDVARKPKEAPDA